MAAQVNPVQSRPAFEGASEIMQAIQLAYNIFGKSKNSEDQYKMRQLEMAEKSLALQTAGEQQKVIALPDEQAQKENYGPALLPEVRQGLALPELAQGQNYYSLASQKNNIDRIKAEQTEELATKKEKEKTKEQLTKEFRKEYIANSFVKSARDTLSGYRRVVSGVESPDRGGASDLVLINGFAKILDPGGVVRPSEFENAEQAMPFLQRYGYGFIANKLAQGGRIDDETRFKMLKEAQRLTLGQLEMEQDYVNSLKPVLDRQGIDINDIDDSSMDLWREKLKAELENGKGQTLISNQPQGLPQVSQKQGFLSNIFGSTPAVADSPFDPLQFIKK
jgi:hypothetical protein